MNMLIPVWFKFEDLDDYKTQMTVEQVERIWANQRFTFDWDDDFQDYYGTYKVDGVRFKENPGSPLPRHVTEATVVIGKRL